ncbi:MAG: phospholipase D-like domain-containing protein [Solirubrobacteraceae bacterium]
MSAADVASRFARRPDFELLAYADVGLPYWRVRTRCELLARKQISPIDEFVLRAVKIGIDRREEISVMLGLDDVILDGTVGAMLAADWVELTGTEQVALTDKGAVAERAALEERSEERMITFEFDGLLRRPLLLDLPLEPNQLAALGAREIPPFPVARPDEFELREHRTELERLIRSYSKRRDREVDLLAIKEVVRRERVFREATVLLFRALQGNEIRVAFVLDDELSDEHEHAFAQARLLHRIGLARGVRSRTQHPKLLADTALALYDADAEQSAREQIEQRRQALEVSGEPNGELDDALRHAQQRLAALAVRTLECYEHPPLLDLVLRSAREDLLLVSPRLTGAVINEDLAGEMRRALKRDVRVRIGYGISRDPQAGVDETAHERLRRLATDYPKLEIAHLGSLKHSALVRDDRLAVVTNFPLLAHRGDATRALTDERGWLLANAELIAEERAKREEAWRHSRPRDFGVPDQRPRVVTAKRRGTRRRRRS